MLAAGGDRLMCYLAIPAAVPTEVLFARGFYSARLANDCVLNFYFEICSAPDTCI